MPYLRRRSLLRNSRIARHVGGENRGEAADGGHMSAGEKLGLTNSSPKQPGGPSITIRCRGGAAGHAGSSRSVHPAGITGRVFVRGSVRRRTRPGGHGHAPGERHNDEEHHNAAVPVNRVSTIPRSGEPAPPLRFHYVANRAGVMGRLSSVIGPTGEGALRETSCSTAYPNSRGPHSSSKPPIGGTVQPPFATADAETRNGTLTLAAVGLSVTGNQTLSRSP